MNPDYKQIGMRIREERLAAGISQAELAERVDVSPQYICLVENGRKQLSLPVLVRIATALALSVDWLLTGHQGYVENQVDAAIYSILSDCSSYERRIVLDIATATKQSLTKHRRLLHDIL